MANTDTIGFPELHMQLRITNRLLAAQLKGTMKQIELIALLASTGGSRREIADVVDTTPETVKDAIKKLRKRK